MKYGKWYAMGGTQHDHNAKFVLYAHGKKAFFKSLTSAINFGARIREELKDDWQLLDQHENKVVVFDGRLQPQYLEG